jgi:hypothetical protein
MGITGRSVGRVGLGAVFLFELGKGLEARAQRGRGEGRRGAGNGRTPVGAG